MSAIEVAPRHALVEARSLGRPGRRTRIPRAVRRLGGPLLLLAVWQLLSATGVLSQRTIAPPSDVLAAAVDMLRTGELQTYVLTSLRRVVVGLSLGVTTGVLLATVSGLFRLGEDLLDSTMQVLRSIPTLGLIPLVIIWFGIGEQPKVLLVAIATTFPVYVNTYAAIRGVDAKLVEAGTTFGLGRLGLVRRVVLPGAVPGFLVGLRFALTTSWIVMIVPAHPHHRGGRTMTDVADTRSAPAASAGPAGARTAAGPNALDVRPIAGHIGAEIHGVDLARPLPDASIAAIRAALLRHRVVFFRGQRLGHAEQIAFARRVGELTYAHPHDDAPPDGFPEIYTVDTRRTVERYGRVGNDALQQRRNRRFGGWHSDVTPAVNPPWGSILRAEVVPDIGGDTTWTSLVSAYAGLSGPIQRLADGLRAEHRYGVGYGGGGEVFRRRIEANLLVAHHPVVRIHPETGERALYVTPGFTSHILDVFPEESRRLLDLFFEELTKPEHTVRFRWRPGDVAFWDNRTTAHQAPRDIDDDVERVLHRVTFVGDVPVGPDGRRSEAVAGAAFGAGTRVAV